MKKLLQYSSFIILFMLTAVALPGEVWAQLTDTTGVSEGLRGAPRAYNYDARTTALGDATVADPTYLTGFNMNPATLSFVRDADVVQLNSYHAWNNNLMEQSITLPAIRYRNHRMAAQFGVIHNGINSLNYRGESQVPEPNLNGAHMDLAYAISYENVLSFGILNSFRYAQNSNNNDGRWSYFASLGVLYAPSESVSYGVAFRGLGHSPVYQLAEAGQLGNSGETILADQNLRESLELGATLKFPVDTDHNYLALSLANEKRFGEDGIWYKIGFEFYVVPALALRSGLLFQPDRDLYTPRFGLGLDVDILKIDYSVSYKDQIFEHFHQLGLTIYFDRL
ncbi:MAG: hypothetical protein WEA56_11090 [Balneolaceae bacterium]